MNPKDPQFIHLGCGLGLRAPHYSRILETRPSVSWFEAISENFMARGGRPLRVLEKIRVDYPVALHGVSLSIGSTDPLREDYLKNLKALIQRIEPVWVSDHLCWTGVEGENLHDLLPLPFNTETLQHVISRVRQVQGFLGRRILLENVSSYLTYGHSTMTEWEFLAAVAQGADCGILLDVNNIYVSSVNHRFDPVEYLNGIPVDRVGQFHLAGYSDKGTYLLDTHDHPISNPVWGLYEKAVKRWGPLSTLIEWDDNIPEFPVLVAEARKAQAIQEAVLGRKSVDTSRAPALDAMDHCRP